MSKKRAPKTAAQLPNAAPVDQSQAASDPSESVRRPKGKKKKRDKKDKAVKPEKAVKAAEGDNKEKREKKEKRGKKNKKAKGKRSESTAAPELRPLRKVNVLLIDSSGQPRAHFDGELGVLDLMLPKKAEGADSGA